MIYRLHREGGYYILWTMIALLSSIGLSLLFSGWIPYLLIGIIVFLLVVFLIFFRNPVRSHGTLNPDAILSPCDGKVVVIEQTYEKEYLKTDVIQLSIFMSPVNVHVNRSPVTGTVEYQQYHPGEYLVAWHPKSSELNERNTVVIKKGGYRILLRQIAGKLARKIVSYTKPGDNLSRGQEFGFIKFGSRVDVFLPLDADIQVKIGDTVAGGLSILALYSKG